MATRGRPRSFDREEALQPPRDRTRERLPEQDELASKLPTPDLFVNAYAGCSTGQQWDDISFRVFGKEVPIFNVSMPYMWSNRLTPRTPMPGVYLCGACTHPGGSVIGINGRNAAMAVIRDLDV